jgi:hypothetical protein
MFSQVEVAVGVSAVAVVFDPNEFKTRRREPNADAVGSSVERILDQSGYSQGPDIKDRLVPDDIETKSRRASWLLDIYTIFRVPSRRVLLA